MDKTPGIERFSLSGRVVLVTGATRGLGLAIARGMAAAGAAVGINGRDPARAGSRPLMPTMAPAAAIPRAISSPSPRVAPVTSTTRSASEKRSSPRVSGFIDSRLLDSG